MPHNCINEKVNSLRNYDSYLNLDFKRFNLHRSDHLQVYDQ